MKPIVENLDEITESLFKSMCIAAMTAENHPVGWMQNQATREIVIYENGDARVQVRSWCNMIDLLIMSTSGKWLCSSHIEGMGAVGVLEEAWRQFLVCKPYIEIPVGSAFEEFKKMKVTTWIMNDDDQNIRIVKGEFTERKNKAGRAEVGYIVYGADDPDKATKAVRQMRKVKETLKAFTGYADQSGDVYMDPEHGNTRVYVVFRGCVRG